MRKNLIFKFTNGSLYTGDEYYIGFDEEVFAKAIEIMEIDRCPVLYKGPYSKEKILELTHHTKSIVCPSQISEGGVVKPTKERKDLSIPTMGGRVILKSINEDYLLRKGNATEFN